MQSNTNGRAAPLIVAVSLFMENMDSTVIATSLPAIARDIGSNPLALKLAVTSNTNPHNEAPTVAHSR
jgi:MFS family permease